MRGLLLLGFDVVNGILDGGDLLRLLVGDIQVERFLERPHQLDDIERIGAQVIDETRRGIDLRLIPAKLLDNDLLDLLLYGHETSTCLSPLATSVTPPGTRGTLKLIDSTEPEVEIASAPPALPVTT